MLWTIVLVLLILWLLGVVALLEQHPLSRDDERQQ